ncbi:MAG: hypothetical protein KR126chlam5_01294 [Candidatus Anoxychlamydiales bacterium]|nr:hypothetical protein [Candidatus Anoxychlamydiales bacterium]
MGLMILFPPRKCKTRLNTDAAATNSHYIAHFSEDKIKKLKIDYEAEKPVFLALFCIFFDNFSLEILFL